MTNPIRQHHAEQFEAEALDYAEEHGLEVKVTRWGVEFYDGGGREVEHWDYGETGAEERVRF
jgi:hypothetical protein